MSGMVSHSFNSDKPRVEMLVQKVRSASWAWRVASRTFTLLEAQRSEVYAAAQMATREV